MRAPYDFLKSLGSYYYLNSCGVLTISVRCSYADHAINLRCIYGLRAFYFFQNLSECGVNEIVEATMPVNPYNADWVSLRLPNGKDDLDIVRASKKIGRQ